MKDLQIGDRVGALSHSDSDTQTIYVFGYGKYIGRRLPAEAPNVIGQAICMAAKEALEHGKKLCDESGADFSIVEKGVIDHYGNPCIELDNGKLVYGCECWWTSEAVVKDQVSRFPNVVELDIDVARATATAMQLSVEKASDGSPA